MTSKKCQQNYANERLKAKGYLFLNEVYESLGIPRTAAGQQDRDMADPRKKINGKE